MLGKRLAGALCGREEIEQIVLHLSSLQKGDEIIQAVIDQILLEKVGYKRENYPLGHKVILDQGLEDSLRREPGQLLGEGEGSKYGQLLPLLLLEELQRLQEPPHDIFEVFDQERPPAQDFLDIKHRRQYGFAP